MRALFLAAAAAIAVGCGEDDRPTTWSYLHEAIVRPNCATVSCHTSANAQAGVKLHSRVAAYTILTGKSCGSTIPDQGAIRNYVIPGDPDRSQLVHLLLGENVRRSMPPDRLLPLADVELIEAWILEGALCN